LFSPPFPPHFFIAAATRIIIGSASKKNRIILFLLSIDPKAGIVPQFVAAIIIFVPIHKIVEVLSCPVIDRIRLDPHA